MARGFGATLGAGTTDGVTTTYTAAGSAIRSWSLWFNRHGGGGGGSGRFFDKRTAGAQTVVLSFNSGFSYIEFVIAYSTIAGDWSTPVPSADAWHHILVTYDSGSLANDPVMFIDGSSVTVTRVGAGPTGSIVTNTDPYVIGNRGAGDRNWDGQFAEFAIWDGVALNGQEAAALARGYSPLLIRAASLAEYLPLLRNNVSIKLAAPTITGTAVQPHPRILMPHNHKLTKLHTVPVFNSAWAKGANLPVLGTGNY